MNEFATDTAVNLLEPGRYGATITDRWCLPMGNVNGGYLLGVANRALEAALPFSDPVATSATYLRQARPGPAEVHVEVVRSGRRLAVGEARVITGGKEVLRVVATFADLTAGAEARSVQQLDAPRLPPPMECERLHTDKVPTLTLAQRLEFRYPALPGWVGGAPTNDASHEFWMRFADGSDADTIALPTLVDAATPPAFEIGVWQSTTVELTTYVRAIPAAGWLSARASTRYLAGGFHEEDFEIWDSEGILVAQSRQLMLDLG
ncbi:Acyl-CoA thioesterase [Frankineae bacterium MT45]|nr:Acyl-CoA thioesterase [Frankineae bacterium MT45]